MVEIGQSSLFDGNLVFHEIGHNMGLSHGGAPDERDRNCEVNYPSAMSYCSSPFGQTRAMGVGDVDADPDDDGGELVLDYSPADLDVDLDEVAGVLETAGVTSTRVPDAALYLVTWQCPPAIGGASSAPPHAPGGSGALTGPERWLDFDCDTVIDHNPVFHDLSLVDTNGNSNPTPLHSGQNDWESLRLAFHRDRDFYESDHGISESCTAAAQAFIEHPRTQVYPGCAAPTVPLTTTATWRIPVVVYGSATLDVTTLAAPRLVGVAPVSSEVRDLDSDGFDDAWYEFRRADLTMLTAQSVALHLYAPPGPGPGLAEQHRVTLLTSPADPDLDGLHSACDACPLQGYPRGPDGCPLGSP